jgi:hypothetical protein
LGTWTLEDLFRYADIDDLCEEEEWTELVFTIRGTRGEACFRIAGDSLADALDQARLAVNRHHVLEGLRREGLTDEDIARLSDADDAWERGYTAGATDAAKWVTEEALAARSAPALATAGEPLTTIDQALRAPGALDDLVNGDGIAITLALVHPAKIVLS